MPSIPTYYNFQFFFPVNEDFINHANMDIQFNGLMDTLLDTSKEEIENLSEIIKDNLGLRFNFFSQRKITTISMNTIFIH